MNLLVTEQMNQCQIAANIFSPLGPCQEMMNVKFFVVEGGFPTFQASAFLSFGELLFRECQVFGLRCLPLDPVVRQVTIIRR
jgi:hypothetical protein